MDATVNKLRLAARSVSRRCLLLKSTSLLTVPAGWALEDTISPLFPTCGADGVMGERCRI